MRYIFAIDETGNFYSDDWSSVCGVLVKGNENDLREAYKEIYKEFGFPEPIPNDAESLLKTNDNKKDKARFHFNKMNNSQKAILKKHLLPFVDQIFVSKGKPSLFANNQSWWLIATTVVIKKFLQSRIFTKEDTIEVWIDRRDDDVIGLVKHKDPKQYQEDKENYHNKLKYQIRNFVKDNSCEVKVMFNSDTSNFSINLADIFCGFSSSNRNNEYRKDEDIIEKKVVCDCNDFYNYFDIEFLSQKNPLIAFNIIHQEVNDGNLNNISYIGNILKQLRENENDYSEIWTAFYDLIKQEIGKRKNQATLISLKDFVDIFLKEFNASGKNKIKTSQSLELMVLFVEYFSHIGAIHSPIDRESFISVLQQNDKNSETRLLRKWEKLVSFTLRETQIYFNAYNFESANKNLETIWNTHTNVLSALKDVLGEKDEPTTALISSLGQSLAFKGEFKEAKDYFELSMDYAIKSNNLSNSHLFNIYHKEENIEQCRALFEQIAKKTAENYAKDKEFEDSWTLIAYCKLRALELYVNKQTNLPAIDLCALSKYNSEYPFPMVMKWEGVALYLENKEGNKETIEKYFSEAIANLLNENNEFVIKTLALPIIQCYALVNNQNPYHRQYNTYLKDLKNTSKYFEKYVDEKSPLLNTIKNESNIWERALSLPFFYA